MFVFLLPLKTKGEELLPDKSQAQFDYLEVRVEAK
jgi:hypothetical protein